MRTQRSGPRHQARGQRDIHKNGEDDEVDNAGLAQEAALLRLSEEQMLVNQALVEKIFACERAELALRASEKKLQELLAHQQANREDERKRISRELHDTFCQNLLALRMDIVMMRQDTTSRHYRLRDRIGVALDNVDVTLRSAKQLLGELRPSGLELGLTATVEMELRKFTRASGIACELHGKPGIDELATDEEEILTLYRVLQECLNNVFRHSLASRVNVRLEAADGWLTMQLVDNGIGFDPAMPRKPNSFGLLDLHERVARHGGRFAVKSARGHGTEIELALPLAPPAAAAPSSAPIG